MPLPGITFPNWITVGNLREEICRVVTDPTAPIYVPFITYKTTENERPIQVYKTNDQYKSTEYTQYKTNDQYKTTDTKQYKTIQDFFVNMQFLLIYVIILLFLVLFLLTTLNVFSIWVTFHNTNNHFKFNLRQIFFIQFCLQCLHQLIILLFKLCLSVLV